MKISVIIFKIGQVAGVKSEASQNILTWKVDRQTNRQTFLEKASGSLIFKILEGILENDFFKHDLYIV